MLFNIGQARAAEVKFAEFSGIFERINQIPFTIPGLTKSVSVTYRLYSTLGSTIVLAILGFILLKIRKIRFAKKTKKTKNNAGFSLIEIIVSVGIMIIVVIFIGIFIRDVANLDSDLADRLATQQEIELTIKDMITEIRSAEISNVGSYPISAASSSTLTFYTDIGGNGVIERIRYFISGDKLKKGIIVPTGNPLQYDPSAEVVSDMVNNLVTVTPSLFTYYGTNFTGTESPLTLPVTISAIHVVEVNIAAREPSQTAIVEFGTRITPRNLRDNL